MNTGVILLVLVLLSIPFLVLAVRVTLARSRELNKRIDDYHAEQEAARKQPGPVNPYQDMAQLFGTDPKSQENPKDQ